MTSALKSQGNLYSALQITNEEIPGFAGKNVGKSGKKFFQKHLSDVLPGMLKVERDLSLFVVHHTLPLHYISAFSRSKYFQEDLGGLGARPPWLVSHCVPDLLWVQARDPKMCHLPPDSQDGNASWSPKYGSGLHLLEGLEVNGVQGPFQLRALRILHLSDGEWTEGGGIKSSDDSLILLLSPQKCLLIQELGWLGFCPGGSTMKLQVKPGWGQCQWVPCRKPEVLSPKLHLNIHCDGCVWEWSRVVSDKQLTVQMVF